MSVRRTRNSVPLVLNDVREDAMKIGRLYASGKTDELLKALGIAEGEGWEEFIAHHIATTKFNSMTHNEKMYFIKGILIENTRINKKEQAEDGIRLNVIMTSPRMAPFKDRIAWTIQEELFPHINYVNFSAKTQQRLSKWGTI